MRIAVIFDNNHYHERLILGFQCLPHTRCMLHTLIKCWFATLQNKLISLSRSLQFQLARQLPKPQLDFKRIYSIQ